jgi:multicomponent Na+:H+ antiporter subunit A
MSLGDPGPRHDQPAPGHRSVVLDTVVRLAFHTVLVFGVYLLFAGHNQPGGGFIGGLVTGSAFILRYVAGGRAELRSAVPVDPRLPLALGLLTATGTGIAAMLLGGQFLESGYRDLHVPVLGEVALVSALLFDIGVYLVVVGLVLGLLRTLGAEAER